MSITIDNLPITYVKNYITNPNEFFDLLWTQLCWCRIENVPRKEYYCNEVQVPYTYGRGKGVRTYQPQPWHPLITYIKNKLESDLNTIFEVCFLNGYEDQSDQLGWHADDSPEMDDERPIAIVSFGVEREIWFCEQGNKSNVSKLLLNNGSLCLMKPGMQNTHFHRIPKAGFKCGARLSLTFRGYVS